MNRYDDNIELTQQIHKVSVETCEEVVPKTLRKELKWYATILALIITAGAGSNLFILDIINKKADVTNLNLKEFNKVVTKVAIIEHDQEDLKKKDSLHDVELKNCKRRIFNIEHKLNIVEKD